MISSPALTVSAVSTSPAPWRHTFESQVNQNTTQEFTLATVANINGRTVPRARMCGFRGFFPVSSIRQSVRKNLEEEHHLPHSLDSSIFGLESDMLSFSTDSRMEKVDNIRFNDAIEAVFYLRDLSVQWRIKGTAHIIGSSDSDPEEQRSRQEISKGLRKLDPPKEEPDPVALLGYNKDEVPQQKLQKEYLPWSWEKVMTIYFANHSPLLRGLFPSPGCLYYMSSHQSMSHCQLPLVIYPFGLLTTLQAPSEFPLLVDPSLKYPSRSHS